MEDLFDIHVNPSSFLQTNFEKPRCLPPLLHLRLRPHRRTVVAGASMRHVKSTYIYTYKHLTSVLEIGFGISR